MIQSRLSANMRGFKWNDRNIRMNNFCYIICFDFNYPVVIFRLIRSLCSLANRRPWMITLVFESVKRRTYVITILPDCIRNETATSALLQLFEIQLTGKVYWVWLWCTWSRMGILCLIVKIVLNPSKVIYSFGIQYRLSITMVILV